ncbi:unnamed protein product [Sphagnum jensenii]|uniref:Uncharacterized protein n=1 Tax=Sphagnum jensenii TaxID=128206 RepID=A0ABP0W117_9BRYO
MEHMNNIESKPNTHSLGRSFFTKQVAGLFHNVCVIIWMNSLSSGTDIKVLNDMWFVRNVSKTWERFVDTIMLKLVKLLAVGNIEDNEGTPDTVLVRNLGRVAIFDTCPLPLTRAEMPVHIPAIPDDVFTFNIWTKLLSQRNDTEVLKILGGSRLVSKTWRRSVDTNIYNLVELLAVGNIQDNEETPDTGNDTEVLKILRGARGVSKTWRRSVHTNLCNLVELLGVGGNIKDNEGTPDTVLVRNLGKVVTFFY